MGVEICSAVQGAIWEASEHKDSKNRPLKLLLPVSHLVSESHQTFPPSSYPFCPTSPPVLTWVLLSSTAPAFLRLQAFSWPWLLHNSIPLSTACLEKLFWAEIYAFDQRAETRIEVLCYWETDQETSPHYNLSSLVPPVAVTDFLL